MLPFFQSSGRVLFPFSPFPLVAIHNCFSALTGAKNVSKEVYEEKESEEKQGREEDDMNYDRKSVLLYYLIVAYKMCECKRERQTHTHTH